mgnify:CR=1 FL=1
MCFILSVFFSQHKYRKDMKTSASIDDLKLKVEGITDEIYTHKKSELEVDFLVSVYPLFVSHASENFMHFSFLALYSLLHVLQTHHWHSLKATYNHLPTNFCLGQAHPKHTESLSKATAVWLHYFSIQHLWGETK